jgi:hypothetical protein
MHFFGRDLQNKKKRISHVGVSLIFSFCIVCLMRNSLICLRAAQGHLLSYLSFEICLELSMAVKSTFMTTECSLAFTGGQIIQIKVCGKY